MRLTPGAPNDVPARGPVSLNRLDMPTGEQEMEATFRAGYFGRGGVAVIPGRLAGLELDRSFS
jgi:hypothetical protein